MGDVEMTFDQMFHTATGHKPFPYQKKLAEAQTLPSLLEAPTGAGKTAAAMLGWLWRRRYATSEIRQATPRRLVYCLPMRVLVEQTRDSAILWLERLGLLVGRAAFEERQGKTHLVNYRPSWEKPGSIAVSVLMGGEERYDWDLWPEHDAIIIGTQDMLLSRALNRGYGMSRYRWPMHFALLNNDSLWVFDEIQLMDSGLATTAQLAASRDIFESFGPGSSLWMSATLRRDWLETVDFRHRVPELQSCRIGPDDWQQNGLKRRLTAGKRLEACPYRAGEPEDIAQLAEFIVDKHNDGSLTLVILNTVDRARRLYQNIQARCRGNTTAPDTLLLHSRFRPIERQKTIKRLLQPSGAGLIVVSTQVVEAGVDISARTLLTELAPWPSLVQRFGRCNRYGDDREGSVYWIEIPRGKKKGDKDQALPYEMEQLDIARHHLSSLHDVSIENLQRYAASLSEEQLKLLFPYLPRHVVRSKDISELFDTTPDLAGNDIDISRFIRDGQDFDVQVFWRNLVATERPSPDNATGMAPRQEELCSVPFLDFRSFLQKKRAYRWDYLERQWQRVTAGDVFPGQVYLVPANEGGYSPELGWLADGNRPVDVIPGSDHPPDDNDNHQLDARGSWQTIAQHTRDVLSELRKTLSAIEIPDQYSDAVITAALWHDRGKAHPVFQSAVPDGQPSQDQWAKAPGDFRTFRRRFNGIANEGIPAKGFRHELASALSMLQAEKAGLACYLAAAHHGKVRLSIRSLPNEIRPPDPHTRFARGIWDGDLLPPTVLGDETAPEVNLSLEPMELGLSGDGKPSWAERMLRLRYSLGPFRLAFLETLLRAADMRASAAARIESEDHYA